MSENKKVLVDISAIRCPHKPLADSTLNNMKKSDLIEYVRMMEKNANAATAMLNQQYENVKNMHLAKWIPVKEKLPEPYASVLVAFDDLCGKVVEVDFFCETGRFSGHGSAVTHWMPLPEAPTMIDGGGEE